MGETREVVFSSKQRVTIEDHAIPDIDRDPLFAEIFSLSRIYTMTPKERVFALYESCKYVAKAGIPGDFVECGVWRGGSSIAAALTFERLLPGERKRLRFFLYDTFEGMSTPTDRDVDLHGVAAKEYIEQYGDDGKWAYCSEKDLLKNFSQAGVISTQLVIVKGEVEETIPRVAPEQISILRLDTDWYESTKHELHHLWPRLSPGGILIIDDYGDWKGSRQATDEFLATQEPLLLHRIDASARLVVKPCS